MRLPDFTAEASLYRATGYRTFGCPGCAGAGYRAHAQLIFPPFPIGALTNCTPCQLDQTSPTGGSQVCTNPVVSPVDGKRAASGLMLQFSIGTSRRKGQHIPGSTKVPKNFLRTGEQIPVTFAEAHSEAAAGLDLCPTEEPDERSGWPPLPRF